jgi:hypothetical protein
MTTEGWLITTAWLQSSLRPDKPCVLAELIHLAEQHNPETRVAWEEAKST